jgi:hypothetical protein
LVYSAETWRVQLALGEIWIKVRAAMQRMAAASDIRPADLSGVFHAVEGAAGHPKFQVGPLVFSIPERPSNGTPNLYIVLRGWIIFAPARGGDERSTTWEFGTEVGYFRMKDDRLVHVYGAHYDMDETLTGHPVFHAHISSQANLASAIDEEFHLPFESDNDQLVHLLRNVRTPTAQMDIFSVITQIGADHLVSDASGEEVKQAFLLLREACDFFVGAAGRISYLNCNEAARCYRATHWYNREAVAHA